MNMLMKYIKRLLICYGLSLILPFQGHAQSDRAVGGIPDGAVRLCFLFDGAVVDSSYMDNRYKLHSRNQRIADDALSVRTDSTDILSFSTSESNLKHSMPLAEERSHAVTEYSDRKYQGFDQHRIHPRPLFALKTNMLFDAAMMPNVELEVPLGYRWSVNGEYMFPWWLFEDEKYSLQILMGGLEGRYWLGNRANRKSRDVLTGHFLGFYAGGGKYDLQWKENGYQGEFFIAAGISYGYAKKIARNFRLEFNIGIGVLRTDYRHYHARDNYQSLLWQENGKYTWFGPTKAKISLVWLLSRKAKKGGAK